MENVLEYFEACVVMCREKRVPAKEWGVPEEAYLQLLPSLLGSQCIKAKLLEKGGYLLTLWGSVRLSELKTRLYWFQTAEELCRFAGAFVLEMIEAFERRDLNVCFVPYLRARSQVVSPIPWALEDWMLVEG